jgi:hypothetical protein
MRLLKAAQSNEDVKLCKELLRFLRAADDTGATLKHVMELVGLIPLHDRETPS